MQEQSDQAPTDANTVAAAVDVNTAAAAAAEDETPCGKSLHSSRREPVKYKRETVVDGSDDKDNMQSSVVHHHPAQ